MSLYRIIVTPQPFEVFLEADDVQIPTAIARALIKHPGDRFDVDEIDPETVALPAKEENNDA